MPPQQITCNPGENICAGNQIAICLLSGHDALLGVDCGAIPGATTTNPATCVVDAQCPTKGGCCKQLKAPCTAAFTTPNLTATASSYYGDSTAVLSCAQPRTCAASTYFAAGVTARIGSFAACPLDMTITSINVSWPRSTIVAGQTLTIPVGQSPPMNVTVTYGVSHYGEGSATSTGCSLWNGTIRFDSDAPSWSVTLNLNCNTDGTIHLVGTLSGNQ